MNYQRRDFFTQHQLLEDWEAPKDWFEHDKLAQIFHQRAGQLPSGSVIALQGGWGTGKTDLLARIFLEEKNSRLDQFGGEEEEAKKLYPIWINPWRQSVPDVISPITSILIERLDFDKDEKEAIQNTLIEGALSLGLKTAGSAIAGAVNPVAGVAVGALSGIYGAYRKSKNKGGLRWEDPVSKLGGSFKNLVDKVITEEEAAFGARLIICIDDLDRCPPHAQVQILESITFLASAGAPVSIYIGLDPGIVTTSIRSRYHVDLFDAEQYLAKIFSTRFNLPERKEAEIKRALEGILSEEFPTGAGTDRLKDIIENNLEISVDYFVSAGIQIFHDTKLGRARLIRKVMNDVYLFASSDSDLKLRDADHVMTLFLWITICNQFPNERQMLIKTKDWSNRPKEPSEIEKWDALEEVLMKLSKTYTIHDFLSLDPYLQIAGL